MKLASKKVIVTGANRSIGRSIATTFAKEGADVVISYNSDEKGAQETVSEIKKHGRNALSIHADFSETSKIQNFFEKALAFFGHIDILVNNAAGYYPSPFLEIDIETFENLFQIGVIAPMLLSQLTAKHMIQKEIQGRIINISSISALRPYLGRGANCTCKAALNMLTKTSALELAPYKICVNAIAPGSTPYEGDTSEDSFGVEIPLRRKGLPKDHAQTALFLASDESSWMTGQILSVDGGQSL